MNPAHATPPSPQTPQTHQTPQAADAPFQLEVLTLGQTVFRGPVRSVTVPGVAGQLGVLPGHTPVLTLLAHGMLSYQTPDGQAVQLPVLGGFAEVGPHGVRVLADHTGRDAEAEQRRMSQARHRALAHPAGAARPTTPEAAKAELDMELLRFFASTQRHKRRQSI